MPWSNGHKLMFKAFTRLTITAYLLGLSCLLQAQTTEPQFIDEAPVNYIYAAVLGTGFYDLNGRQIAVVRMPFSTGKYDLSEDTHWRVIYPVAVGYENIGEDNDFEKWIPSEILSVTAVPGVEFFYAPDETWLVKPFLQLGLGRDFTQDKTTSLLIAGSRILGDMYKSELWDITLGSSLQWAGEHMQHTDQYSSFAMFEAGMDFKRHLPVKVFNRRLNMSFFGVWQHFFLQRNNNDPLAKVVDVDNLLKLGFSLGLNKPKKVLGFKVDTVSVGLSFGKNSYALTFGTGFPF